MGVGCGYNISISEINSFFLLLYATIFFLSDRIKSLVRFALFCLLMQLTKSRMDVNTKLILENSCFYFKNYYLCLCYTCFCC